MFEDEPKCIIIRDEGQEDDCNNRITQLRSQRFCDRNARLCEQVCQVCQRHGDQNLKKDHTKISIEEFIKAFEVLEQTCSRETEHYIRQINEAERNARETIEKKKLEYLRQIEDIKIHMMKKTYRTLQTTHQNLYEKYKNERFDTLKCCEVFWAVNVMPIHHTIKHSDINRKLEQILKKFQNFKEVSKNIGPCENMFNTKKARAKKGKINQKLAMMEHSAYKINHPEIDAERLNIYREKQDVYKRQIAKLGEELVSLKEKKINYEKDVRKLEYQINNLVRMKNMKSSKIKIFSGVFEIKEVGQKSMANQEYLKQKLMFEEKCSKEKNQKEISIVDVVVSGVNQSIESINSKGQDAEEHQQEKMHKEDDSEPEDEEHHQSQEYISEKEDEIQDQNDQNELEVEQEQPEKDNEDEPQVQSSKPPSNNQPRPRQPQEADKNDNDFKMRLAATIAGRLNSLIEPNQQSEIHQQFASKSKSNELNEQRPEPINSSHHIIDQFLSSQSDNRAGQIRFTQSMDIIPLSVSSVGPVSSQRSAIEQSVKIEQKGKFIPWRNAQLLEQIRKSGNKSESALKVEDFDALSELPFMKPPPNYLQGNIQSIRSSQGSNLTPLSSPAQQNKKSSFDKLFQAYESKKNSSQKDKGQKK